MAELYRRRALTVGGLIEDNPLSSGATTLTSAGLMGFGALVTDEYFPIVLDPDGQSGSPEIAFITAHTAAASTATISRGREGTTARACDRDTPWVHSTTVKDFDGRDGGSGLLGYKVLTNASLQTINATVTLDDVDASLAFTFVAPPSGKVLLRATGVAFSAASSFYYWSWKEVSTEVTTRMRVMAGANQYSVSASWIKTGLTPNASYTYKFAHIEEVGNGGIQYGSTMGDVIIELWGVNV